jgi:hypothetical protein
MNQRIVMRLMSRGLQPCTPGFQHAYDAAVEAEARDVLARWWRRVHPSRPMPTGATVPCGSWPWRDAVAHPVVSAMLRHLRLGIDPNAEAEVSLIWHLRDPDSMQVAISIATRRNITTRVRI